MKKIILIFSVLSLLCASCTDFTTMRYNIKGTVTDDIAFNGETIYLKLSEDDRPTIDSTVVAKNAFTFKGKYPKCSFANITSSKEVFTFYMESGTINVKLSKYSTASGTPINDAMNVYTEKINTYKKEIDGYRKQYFAYTDDQKEEREAILDKWFPVEEKIKEVNKASINDNLDNVLGAYYLRKNQYEYSPEQINDILAKASPEMKNSACAQDVIKRLEALERTAVGQKYIDFTLNDQYGQEHSLSDFVGHGKYILLDFWASWCGPCCEEIPYLKEAYAKYKSKGFEIVGVTLDNNKDEWVNAIKEYGITWTQLSDSKVSLRLYGVLGIPATFLIDPEGTIIINENFRGEEIDKILSKLLK